MGPNDSLPEVTYIRFVITIDKNLCVDDSNKKWGTPPDEKEVSDFLKGFVRIQRTFHFKNLINRLGQSSILKIQVHGSLSCISNEYNNNLAVKVNSFYKHPYDNS